MFSKDMTPRASYHNNSTVNIHQTKHLHKSYTCANSIYISLSQLSILHLPSNGVNTAVFLPLTAETVYEIASGDFLPLEMSGWIRKEKKVCCKSILFRAVHIYPVYVYKHQVLKFANLNTNEFVLFIKIINTVAD